MAEQEPEMRTYVGLNCSGFHNDFGGANHCGEHLEIVDALEKELGRKLNSISLTTR